MNSKGKVTLGRLKQLKKIHSSFFEQQQAIKSEFSSKILIVAANEFNEVEGIFKYFRISKIFELAVIPVVVLDAKEQVA